jgi:hypothetical protein
MRASHAATWAAPANKPMDYNAALLQARAASVAAAHHAQSAHA